MENYFYECKTWWGLEGGLVPVIVWPCSVTVATLEVVLCWGSASRHHQILIVPFLPPFNLLCAWSGKMGRLAQTFGVCSFAGWALQFSFPWKLFLLQITWFRCFNSKIKGNLYWKLWESLCLREGLGDLVAEMVRLLGLEPWSPETRATQVRSRHFSYIYRIVKEEWLLNGALLFIPLAYWYKASTIKNVR